MLPQLFNQLATHADRYTDLPGLYDSRGDNPHQVARDVAVNLRAAAAATNWLAGPLTTAHEACSRLGIQTPKENQ